MTTVRMHHDTLLATCCSRVCGDFEAKVAERRVLLERLGIAARSPDALAAPRPPRQ
jgi:hypothetical protein